MSHGFSFLLYWCAAILALVAQAMLVRSLLLGRTPGAEKSRAAAIRETAWVLLPALMLLATLVLTWSRVRSWSPRTATPSAQVVER
ncbi:MAG: hypothetical protein MNPFHGCM_02551 [Gemmatimonadaceae bacterium]|nr:hypothetical protein [Gemmatimonadaceae bacterium]